MRRRTRMKPETGPVKTYQVMPPLSEEEYAALKADIAARGILVPVEVDEQGTVLDGYHRVRAWEELRAEGIPVPDYPRAVRPGMTEVEKRTYARTLNLARRHLTQEQKRALIRGQLQDTPEKSNRQIAALLGVSHPTVAVVRFELAGGRFTTPQGTDEEPDWWHWAEARLDGPFTPEDFDGIDVGWITTKLLHRLRAPVIASMLYCMARDYKVPALQLAPADELVELLRLAVPYAKSPETCETVGVSLHDMIALKMTAQRICGVVFGELERREKARRLNRHQPSRKAVLRQLLQRIDEALARLGDSTSRSTDNAQAGDSGTDHTGEQEEHHE